MRILVAICSLALLSACSDKETGGQGCQNNGDCGAGQACLSGECKTLCASDGDCSTGEICNDTTCEVGTRGNAPRITAIDGDGSPNSSTTHPSGTLTAHHVQTQVMITGEHFGGASVSLVDGSTSTALVVASASDTELVALLPTDLQEGRYLLRVENAVGSDQADTWVLQGEAGPTGPTGPAPSTAEIQAAVSAMTNLDVPTLGGRPAAGYQTTALWGNLFEAEGTMMASAAVGGEALAAGDTADASGGQGRRGRYNNGTGLIAGFSSADLGELLATSLAVVEFRMMVPDNTTQATTDLGTIRCDGTRHDGATTFSQVHTLQPGKFTAADAWQVFSLRCDFAPGDTAQSIAVDFTNDTVTDLSIDYVRITPVPAAVTYRVAARSSGDLGDIRTNSTVWADIANRTLTFQKLQDATLLRLTYSDILGTQGSTYGGCQWRLMLDGSAVASFSAADDQRAGGSAGWEMEDGTHTAIVDGVAPGQHTFTVQHRISGAATECLSGWNRSGEYVMVEELAQ